MGEVHPVRDRLVRLLLHTLLPSSLFKELNSNTLLLSAIGFLNPPSFTIARLLGGLIALRTSSSNPSHKVPLVIVVIASGFVLGEGLTSILGLAMKSAGVGGPVSCWGCNRGDGGYCASC